MHTPPPPLVHGDPAPRPDGHGLPFGPGLCPAERVEGRCGGRPTFTGTRVEPRHVHARFWAGETLAALAEDFPHVPFPSLRWAILHGHLLMTLAEQDSLVSDAAP